MRVLIFFLVLVPFISAKSVDAQKQVAVRKIGFLGVTGGGPIGARDVLLHSLAEIGHIEGKNIAVAARNAESRRELAELANELVREKVEVIVASGGWATRAARDATQTVPIVFTTSGDPIEAGFADSVARPGRNMTGLSWMAFELIGKRLELLKEAVPSLSRVAILSNPQHAGERRELRETQSTAKALGLALEYHQTNTSAEFDSAFEAVAKEKANGLLVFPELVSLNNRLRIIEFAIKHRLPNMFGWKEFAEAGALMAYGPNRDESYKRLAVYVDKILKGTKPTDLPVEYPKRFELIINLKTAKQIRVIIPPNVLARADRVIR